MRTYSNVTLVPRGSSQILHRNDCGTGVMLRIDIQLEIPIIASPMPDICNGMMATTMHHNGALGIIHRFQSIESQVREFNLCTLSPTGWNQRKAGCAIGVTNDFLDRYRSLFAAGCRIFCLDTANGANIQVKRAIEAIRGLSTTRILEDTPFIIAGNVATREQFSELSPWVDAVRVGIAGGSVCETKTETGVYLPTLESVVECKEYRDHYGVRKSPLIIADGGIQNPSDMCKALACGADLIMAGRIFAGYQETPGAVQKWDGKFYKSYRGAASYGVQQEYTNEKPDFSEGDETLVPYIDKSVVKVLQRFKAGLQSSMSYMDARSLAEYRQNVFVEKL